MKWQVPDIDWLLDLTPSTKISHIGWDVLDVPMIGVKTDSRHSLAGSFGFGLLVPQMREGESVREVQQANIDFTVPKGWLEFCRDNHTEYCALEAKPDIPFFKLIDCETRRLVQYQDQPYATLSYVWGNDKVTDFSEVLPTTLPCTIEDAITVVLRFGLRFLWVDKYCINQRIEEERQRQLEKMDMIYESSEITIIAASGSNPSLGLPGVST